MNDPIVAAFAAARLPAGGFHHREHLYVAWCYLKEMAFDDALARYLAELERLTAALGASRKFSPRVTRVYFDRLAEALEIDPGLTFAALLDAHPRLLARP
jgi:hypothetical protein